MPRRISHYCETTSKDMVRSMIDGFYSNGDALVREWSERDYGIDFVLELFADGYPTGKIVFLQIKGTEKVIEKLKNSEEVSCPHVSVSSFEYARQDRIPFILVYASTMKIRCFYYVDLQRIVQNISLSKTRKTNQITVRIPVENKAEEDLTGFFELINKYF